MLLLLLLLFHQAQTYFDHENNFNNADHYQYNNYQKLRIYKNVGKYIYIPTLFDFTVYLPTA